MYVAAIACNVAGSHWKVPAQWMYYHLLDGDWASNALSWQWVAGSNSNKKYIANQENINKYCYSSQCDTFLDVPYEIIGDLETPDVLKDLSDFGLQTPLPESVEPKINQAWPTQVYTSYNLDPSWRNDLEVNRILLLEPSHFKQYPVSQKVMDFILALAKNIPDIQVYVGEFHELKQLLGHSQVYYKEHPTCLHYEGTPDDRDWMFTIKGYYPSFFNFWKKCKKEWQRFE